MSVTNPAPPRCGPASRAAPRKGLHLSILSIDFETRSTIDLKKSGVQPYAEHPTTDVWLMAWAFDDEEPEVWYAPHVWATLGLDGDGTSHLPHRIIDHILAGGEIRAWNAGFEKTIWREIMVKRYGAPEVKLEQWVDTMAEASAMALPRSLEECAGVCGIKQQKDPEGYRLMMRMARPRKIVGDLVAKGWIEWWDVPEKILRLTEYAKQDVRTERAMVPALRRLVPRERQMWLLDQKINDRGIRLDRELVLAAQDIADEGARRAGAALSSLSKGKIATVTDLNGFKRWLKAEGVDAPSLAKKAMRELMEPELPIHAREALQLRQEAGKASVAKLKAMLHAVARGGRLHGLLRYHAASTGRWGGALVQPQNLPRGEVDDIEAFIDAVLARDYDGIDLFEPPVVVVSSMLRSMLMAEPGHDLIAADFAAIEARVVNWLAGQDDILELFASGADVYKHMAVAMGRAKRVEDIAKNSDDRQAGKAAELGCGFQMGAAKFVTAAWDVYGVRVTEEQAKVAVKAYRSSHPKVEQLWWDANNAVIRAVENPGEVVVFGGRKNLRATKRGSYLYIILPSGRPLAYAAPKIVDAEMPWSTPEAPAFRPSVEFSGFDSRPGAPRRWSRMRLYGGLIVENIVQAVARDLMAEGMWRAEEAGYPVVLTVHDEVVSEIPEGWGTVEAFEGLLSKVPTWAKDLPVKAEGWRGRRYRK